ncbi:hypothetical protein, partial [Pantoea ananatis]|uniref:hypothetical protein n=1 Tax=Pantoea ananas TaxID=553 RepID=UPI001B31043B
RADTPALLMATISAVPPNPHPQNVFADLIFLSQAPLALSVPCLNPVIFGQRQAQTETFLTFSLKTRYQTERMAACA